VSFRTAQMCVLRDVVCHRVIEQSCAVAAAPVRGHCGAAVDTSVSGVCAADGPAVDLCVASPRRSNRKGRERDSRPEALAHLLADTGLRFEFLNPRTVRIYAQPPLRPTVSAAVAIAPERRASGYRAAPTARPRRSSSRRRAAQSTLTKCR